MAESPPEAAGLEENQHPQPNRKRSANRAGIRLGNKEAKDPSDPKEPLPRFSQPASELYYMLVNRYLVDLERLSRFKAKSGSMEVVSKQHVEQAGAFLSFSRVPSKKSRYCETAGGILLGAGVAELISIVQNNDFTARLVVITAILIAVGGVLIGIFLGRE